jgi:hypothetical protein
VLGELRTRLGRVRHFHGRAELLAALPRVPPREMLGQRVLFVYKDTDPTDHQAFSLVRHLRRLGDVAFVSFTAAERPRHDPSRASGRLFRALERSRAEVVLAYNNILSIEEVDAIKQRGIRLGAVTNGVASFTWGAPPHVTQGDVIAALRRHDWYLVPHAPHVPRLQAEGINALELPHWFEPRWFRPLALSPRYDVLFVGDVASPLNRARAEMIDSLAADFDVAAMSFGAVPGTRVRRVAPTTNPNALNRVINQARLVVGSDRLSGVDALNTYPGQYLFYADEFFIRQRTYLMLGAGACYLVERHPDLEHKFEPDRDLVAWTDTDDLRARVRELLGNEQARQRIGRRGAARAAAEHTTARRVETLRRLIVSGEGD